MEEDDIPKSIIKGSGFINADLSHLSYDAKILAINLKYSVIGIGDTPYHLFATPEFKVSELNQTIAEHIYGVRLIVLQHTFSVDPEYKASFSPIPRWIVNFKNVLSLTLDHMDLNEFDKLTDLKIEHLILHDIRYSDELDLAISISKLKNLTCLAYDESLSSTFTEIIKQLSPGLNTLSCDDYYKSELAKKFN